MGDCKGAHIQGENRMNTVQNIGVALSTEYVLPDNVTEGMEIERILTNICKDLGKVSYLVDNKADLEFLLMIVGSYLIAQKDGGVGLEEGALAPSELFDINLIPQIRNMSDVVVEAIEDE